MNIDGEDMEGERIALLAAMRIEDHTYEADCEDFWISGCTLTR